jgi:hypothetical protein
MSLRGLEEAAKGHVEDWRVMDLKKEYRVLFFQNVILMS